MFNPQTLALNTAILVSMLGLSLSVFSTGRLMTASNNNVSIKRVETRSNSMDPIKPT